MSYRGQFGLPVIYNPYFVTVVAVSGAILFGFDISSVSAFVSDSNYRTYFGYPSSLAQGGITAAMAGGSFVTSLIVGPFSDWLGRRTIMQVAAIFWIIGAAIQTAANNQAALICGRLIAGFGIGFATSTVPVYISELAPKRIRGRLGGFFQWSTTWGILIMFYIGYGASKIRHPMTAGFRLAWGIQMIPGALMLLGSFFLAESPRWLAAHGRWDECEYIIRRIHQGQESEQETDAELAVLREEVEIEKNMPKVSPWELFNRKSWRRTMVGCFTMIWQQLTGINVVMYYIVVVFEMAGYTGNSSLISSSINFIINVVMTIPAILWIDRFGRRPVLLVGAVLMMIWMFAIAGLFATYGEHVADLNGNTNVRMVVHHKGASKGIIACCYLFVASFAPTWGPGAWIYVSEIFPLHQRGYAVGLSTACNWIFNFALALFVPTAFQNITWKTYLLFGVFCAVMFLHVFFMFPETRGKSLEEIDEMWDSGIPAWRTHSKITSADDTRHPANFITSSQDKMNGFASGLFSGRKASSSASANSVPIATVADAEKASP